MNDRIPEAIKQIAQKLEVVRTQINAAKMPVNIIDVDGTQKVVYRHQNGKGTIYWECDEKYFF